MCICYFVVFLDLKYPRKMIYLPFVNLTVMKKIYFHVTEGSFIQFKNREKAGESLSYLLKKRKKFNTLSNQLITIAIPLGGTIVGDVIARNLKSSFDIILPQRLVSPHNRESTIGSIMKDGSTYLDYKIISKLKISDEYLEKEKKSS